jgi:hypothetical protein
MVQKKVKNPCLRVYNSCTSTQHFHSCVISGFGRGVNEICAVLGFYAALIGSFLPTFWDNHWGWWNSHSDIGEDSSHLGRFALSTGQYTFIFRASSPRWRHCSAETSVTLHQGTGRNLHQHLCVNVMADRIEDGTGLSYCVWRVFCVSVTIIAAFTKMPFWTYFSFLALYIKTNTNKCSNLQSVYSSYYV